VTHLSGPRVSADNVTLVVHVEPGAAAVATAGDSKAGGSAGAAAAADADTAVTHEQGTQGMDSGRAHHRGLKAETPGTSDVIHLRESLQDVVDTV
jgi:hypothetical protein